MGTRSMIAIEDAETNVVTATYCHYDGYLTGVGATLVEHYATAELAVAVTRAGYLSSLEDDLAVSLAEAVNKAKPTTYDDASRYFQEGKESWCEYLYLYRQGVWFYAEPGAAGPMIFRSDDPNAEGEEIWRNVAGVLQIGEKPHGYLVG